MRRVTLPGAGVSVTRFIFGTASLFRAGRRNERERVLDAAYDHGLTHFDTAPYYGFGTAERDLKALLARHPDAGVTTKVGLYSPGGEKQPEAAIFLRKALGKLAPAVSKPIGDWSVARARAALDDSLRRLGRERIELYMLHEPLLGGLDTEEWLHWLQDEVGKGRVGQFGVAGDGRRIVPFLEQSSKLADLVQTNDSLEGREADRLVERGHPTQITYGYVSAAIRRNRHADVSATLAGALDRNRSGAVIIASRHPQRMRQYADVAAS